MGKAVSTNYQKLTELMQEAYAKKKTNEGLTLRKMCEELNAEGFTYTVALMSRHMKASKQIKNRKQLEIICKILGIDSEIALALRPELLQPGSTPTSLSVEPIRNSKHDFFVTQFEFDRRNRQVVIKAEPDDYNFPSIIGSRKKLAVHLEALGYMRCDKPTDSPEVNSEFSVYSMVNPLKLSRQHLDPYIAITETMSDLSLITAFNAFEMTIAIKSYKEMTSIRYKLEPPLNIPDTESVE